MKVIFFYSPAVICDEYWADFFGTIWSDLWILRKIQSVVWIFLLSSLRFHIVVSDSERESFQKIRGEKFKLGPGLTHNVEIPKIL